MSNEVIVDDRACPAGAVETDLLSPVYATMWRRFVAYLADTAIVYVIMISAYLVAGMAGKSTGSSETEAKIVYLLALFCYMVLAHALFHTTMGKYVAGLEVLSAQDGERYPSLGSVFLRETVGRVCAGLFLGIGYWLAIPDPRKQAWSDRLAKTLVCRRPTNRALRAAFCGFIVLGALLDGWMIGYGYYLEQQEKRRTALEQQVETLSTRIAAQRQSMNQLVSREPDDMPAWQNHMREMVKILGPYDKDLEHIDRAIGDGLQQELWHDAQADQYRALQQAFAMRRQQSAKLRQQAETILNYRPGSDEYEFWSKLAKLESEIDRLNSQADRVLNDAGIK